MSKNANLWRDYAVEQSLVDMMSSSGQILGTNERGFDRGTESYIMPKEASFDDVGKKEASLENRAKKSNQSGDSGDEDLFGTTSNSGPTSEFGVKGSFRLLKRKATAGRGRNFGGGRGNFRNFNNRQQNCDGRRNSNDTESGIFSYNPRKRKFTGSKESLSSNTSSGHNAKRFNRELPMDLLMPEYSLEKLKNAHFSKQLSSEELGKQMAEVMGDQNPGSIIKAVELAGKEICLAIFNETKRIEENGGMMIANKTRRRTPGGVFLTLFRNNESISEDAKKELNLFSQNLMREKEKIKQNEMKNVKTDLLSMSVV